jgi:hypothetical protein
MDMQLKIEPIVTDDRGRKILSSLLSINKHRKHRFFFAVEEEDYHESMAHRVMPYLLSQLMHAMRFGGTLSVEGVLRRADLPNLQAFMRRWILWCPDLFRELEIVPTEWSEDVTADGSRHGAISCFSGGVDSFYSYATLEKDVGIPVRSLLFLHGFDIDLSMADYFDETSRFYQDRLKEKGIKLLRLRTNAKQSARKFQLNWGKVGHGIYLAAALHLMGRDHALACIPSSHSPDSPITPWGSHPITDPFFASSELPFIHHDYMVPRFEKIVALAHHDDCLEMVRVCWAVRDHQLNCGYCSKCMATLLALEVAKPESWRVAFPKVPNLASVLRVLDETEINRFQLEQIAIVRRHAALAGRDELASQIAAIVEKKSGRQSSVRTQLRRWFYDGKLRRALS